MTRPTDLPRGALFWIGPDSARTPEARYAHPHVIVSDDVLNASRIPIVIVMALTTNLAKANEPGNVLLDEGEGALPRRSVIVVSQIDAVEKTKLGGRIGALSPARVDAALAGLRFLQEAYFRR